ncbi:hypothetical protein ABZ753_08020 [Streptomyces griseoincarnatus]
MAKKKVKKPEGHCRCCSRRDGLYQTARWLGPLYTIYTIVRDYWAR